MSGLVSELTYNKYNGQRIVRLTYYISVIVLFLSSISANMVPPALVKSQLEKLQVRTKSNVTN